MDLKNVPDKVKQSPRPRPDRSLEETHSRKSKCSTSEDCSKSVTGSEYFIHYDCTSGTPTTKSSMSRNETLDWPELKAVLDNTKLLDEKHKIPFRNRFPEKSSMKSQSNIISENGCISDDEMKKTASTQRSEAESYVHNELFERKMNEMRELYGLRIKHLHDKLDRANQSNQILKAQLSKITKEHNASMFEVQRDNTSLRRLIKGLSKKATMPDSENLQKIVQLENYVVMLQRKSQVDGAKLKELQSLQGQYDNEIRNMQSDHSEKMMSLMKEYQCKLEEMEKSYMTQMSNLEADHQELLSERENEIKRLHGQIHQQYLKMEHEMNSLKDKKNDSETVLKDLESQLKCAERKREIALRFLEGPFMKDFTELVKENHSLKMLLLKHSSEAWGYVFEEVLNFSKELEKLNGDSEKIAHHMEAKINDLRDSRQEMGDHQDSFDWMEKTGN